MDINRVLLTWAFLAFLISPNLVQGIGVNWGTQASQNLQPSTIVQMLKDNKIDQVKLFDSDHWTVKFFAGTGIEVMLGIPNNQLAKLANDYDEAKDWVKENVTKHLYDGGVKIKYVAVGNEPFLKSYNGSNLKTTFPALKNIQKALDEAGIGDKIKVTIPQNADVYESGSNTPSAGNFRSDIKDNMIQILKFFKENNSPFLVNIYPFLSLYQNPDFPMEFAFFDGGAKPVQDKGISYSNMFDANLDTLVWSLRKVGIQKMKIIVGEIGWPTEGHIKANVKLAQKFYDGFFKKMATNKGTPLYPGDIDYYLFSLTDENQKSIAPGDFERHWGVFRYDGQPKFPVDFTDCTSLNYPSSCNKLGSLQANISYAFNMYFQMQNQDVEACNFQGLAKIVKTNASTPECLFPLALQSAGTRLWMQTGTSILAGLLVLLALF
ncbi:O-Glycosyl hydrolase family 17 protein [Abeliophyllum distichum]|uniref:O-Glycosyl hydrolase family 17 protein n=1 Tax=Abeliophyllum distichum TaxID=126358 RepID=A0ABD1SGB4_9LAMI